MGINNTTLPLILSTLIAACWISGCACGPCSPEDGCPEGATAKGDKPPSGTEWWCEKDDAEGVREGPSIKWHANGQKAEEGEYKDGKKVGRWTEWYENAQVQIEAEYYGGEKDGPYISYYDDGAKRAEGAYDDGKMDGPWINYHSTGKISEEGDMASGEKVGKWTFYDKSGNKERSVRYVDGVEQEVKGAKEAPRVVEGVPDGDVNDPTAPVGRQDERCKDGAQLLGSEPPQGDKIWCERDGKKQGLWMQWWENGTLWIEGEYTDDRRSGTWTEHYDNGIVTSKGDYARDKKQGAWVYKYANGQTRESGEYLDDNKIGTWVEYHDDGRIKAETPF